MLPLTQPRTYSLSTLFLFTMSLSLASVSSGYGEPSAAQKQVQTLQRKVDHLRKREEAFRVKHDQLTQVLQQRETLLLMRDFKPVTIRSMSALTSSLNHPKAKSPLPKKRSKVRYMKDATDQAQTRNLSELLQKTPTLIALWATWCKPCVAPQEQAHLKELRKRLQTYGIPLISIGIDQWSKVNRNKKRWFYPLWHLQDAHLNLTPEIIFKEVGLGLPLFFLRLPDGSVPYYLPQTLSDESVDEWVTLAIRAKLAYSFGEF